MTVLADLASWRRRGTAEFDQNDHATSAGWATYHTRPGYRRRLCGLLGHKIPDGPPDSTTRFGPSNYTRCRRCDVWVKWFRDGQHRFGGYDRRGKANR